MDACRCTLCCATTLCGTCLAPTRTRASRFGAEAVLAAMRSINGYVRLELHDVVGNDEHAVALLKARGDRESHRYESLEVDVFHVRDGKIAEFWSFAEDQRKTDAYWS